jgi:hypothetical protein
MLKKKDMKVKGGTIWGRGRGWEERRQDRVIGGEYDQSTLRACVEMSQ